MPASGDLLLAPGVVLLGRYRLVRPLGEGLGGETWRADPVDGGPAVAIKVVRGADLQRADLLREASFLRELQHPHVVAYGGVIDLPESDTTFLVTALAEGGTLEDYVAGIGPRPAQATAALLLQLVEALEAVHAGGVLHRDLKPQNVLVRPVPGGLPHLLLADFGISRRTIGNLASLTRPMGSLGYGAPEIWTDAVVTHAADVYGLGAVAWFLLTGRHPVPKLGTTTADPGQLAAELGPAAGPAVGALVALVQDAMRVEPKARPTLREVRARLVRVAETPVAAYATLELTPPPRPAPTASGRTLVADAPRPAPARWPLFLAGFGGTLGAVLVVGLLAWGWARGRAPEEPATAPVVAPPVAEEGAPGESASAPEPVAAIEPARIEPTPAPPRTTTGAAATTPAEVAAPADAAVPAPAPKAVATPPEASATPPLTGGRYGGLRVGLDLPSGLPADAVLVVVAPDGTRKEAANTQVLLRDGAAGVHTIEVRVPTRLLGRDTVTVPADPSVRVVCLVPGGAFGALSCEIRPSSHGTLGG